MNTLSVSEMVSRIEEVLATLEENEHQFYLSIDLAYQLRDELTQLDNSDSYL